MLGKKQTKTNCSIHPQEKREKKIIKGNLIHLSLQKLN